MKQDERPALYSERWPGALLPTLDGCVHGIVGREPWEVQCDKCFVVRSGDAQLGVSLIIFANITFNPRATNDDRRLCSGCRTDEWPDYDRWG